MLHRPMVAWMRSWCVRTLAVPLAAGNGTYISYRKGSLSQQGTTRFFMQVLSGTRSLFGFKTISSKFSTGLRTFTLFGTYGAFLRRSTLVDRARRTIAWRYDLGHPPVIFLC